MSASHRQSVFGKPVSHAPLPVRSDVRWVLSGGKSGCGEGLAGKDSW